MAKEVIQVTAQYDKAPAVRMVINWVDTVTEQEGVTIVDRDDMGNPDVQIFDNFKNLVEQHIING